MNTARPSSNQHHEAYLKKIAHKWKVWITPASRVGGELPLPIPFRSQREAREYARACRMKGQRTRITPPTPVTEGYSFADLEKSPRVDTRKLIAALDDYATSGAAIYAPVVIELIKRVQRESAVPDEPTADQAVAQMWRTRLYQIAQVGAESQQRRGFAKDAEEYQKVMNFLKPKAKQIVDALIDDVPPEDQPPSDITQQFAKLVQGDRGKAKLMLMLFKQKARGYIKWIAAPDGDQMPGPDPEDLKALRDAKTFEQAEAILAKYDTAHEVPQTGFLAMLAQGYF